MKRILPLVAFLLAPAAQAQAVGALLVLTVGGRGSYVAGPGDCDNKVQVLANVSLPSGVLCSGLDLWVTEGECGDTAGTKDFKLEGFTQATLTNQRTGTFEFQVRELPVFASADAAGCGVLSLDAPHRVCGAFSVSSFDCGTQKQVIKPSSIPTVTYDSLAPAAPVITSVSAGDGALTVSYEANSSDAIRVQLELRAPGQVDFVGALSGGAGASSLRLEGLENNVPYEVRALAFDEAENVSASSNVVTATPVHTQGFFEVYRRSGGSDQGCSAVGGGALVAAAVLVALRFGSRRRQR